MATGTSYRTPGKLPPQTSGFVGRVAELGRARDLLLESRLVTITGPGGVGKTRLAVRVASEAAAGFRDGARLIELSGVRDPGLLMHTVAAELTLAELSNAESDQGSQVDTLLGFIRDRELLLVLDTCDAGGHHPPGGAWCHHPRDEQAAARRVGRGRPAAAPAARARLGRGVGGQGRRG
jgi:hypothetical protein